MELYDQMNSNRSYKVSRFLKLATLETSLEHMINMLQLDSEAVANW